jgi:hypothetical protein
MIEPPLPGELRYVVEDALAEFTGIRRSIEAFGFGTEDDALNGSGHLSFPNRA